jgi:NTE family protein
VEELTLTNLDARAGAPSDGIGLCLSGGGYRAMLFHVGALWRFVDAGKLKSLTRISSVSGGSITAAVLALGWDQLADGDVDSFQKIVVGPIRKLASTTIDRMSIISGVLLPGGIGDYVSKAYSENLFGNKTLQALPDEPRFIINATNLETGSLFRFSKRHNSDWRLGQMLERTTKIADAVAASSAFPPLLSPFILKTQPSDFTGGQDIDDDFKTDISLTDGGVYDNLGIETVWKRCATVFVSDGGGRLPDDSEPPADWARQSKRILDVIDHQVRNLRKRQVIQSLANGNRSGAYWGIRTDIADYELDDSLPCPYEKSIAVADEPTRLKRMTPERQEQIINWGYAVTDAALRRHYDPKLVRPAGFPYPGTGIG